MRHLRPNPIVTERERQLQAEVESWKQHSRDVHALKVELVGLTALIQAWQTTAAGLTAWKRDDAANIYHQSAEELQLEVQKLQAVSVSEDKEHGTQK